MSEPIQFYNQNQAYGFLSNFAPNPIFLKDKIWATSEHYFQAQKFAGTHHEEEIRLAETPTEAARLGRDRSKPLRNDWEKIKDDTMRSVLLAKYTQHLDLKEKLIRAY